TGLKGGNNALENAATRIAELERQADSLLRSIVVSLSETFITPIDAEDIHSLSSKLDDVMEGVEDLAYRMVGYHVDPVPPVAVEVAGDLVSCIGALDSAFRALRDHGSVMESCLQVSRIKKEVDVKIRAALSELFRTEKDPIHLIKVKEVLDLLEDTTDYCEDVSVVLQNVFVKNS
ncbi:MAG: DUF47 family protein, partial [Bryobacteraceae bacterium]|nr:DUF47 family protein [Bryobacteraceae bacterium]